jgi:hypothetical protein
VHPYFRHRHGQCNTGALSWQQGHLLGGPCRLQNLIEDFQHISLKQVMAFCILVHGWQQAAYDYLSSLQYDHEVY